MNLYDRSTVKLSDVASYGRAKPGTVYREGTITLQVSATHGQTDILREPGEVAAKFAVIEPDRSKIVPDYLLFVLRRELPAFLSRYQTTINIQIGVLDLMTLDIHNELDTQRAVAEVMGMAERMERCAELEIERLKEFKRWHLDAMMV